jgi:hypothetical protein
MELIGVSHKRVDTVLPVIFSVEFGIIFVIEIAKVSLLFITSDLVTTTTAAASIIDISMSVDGSSKFVIFASRIVLGSQMPMDIDGAKTRFIERSHNGHSVSRIDFSLVSHSDIGARLFESVQDTIDHTGDIVEVVIRGSGAVTRILARIPRGSSAKQGARRGISVIRRWVAISQLVKASGQIRLTNFGTVHAVHSTNEFVGESHTILCRDHQ